VIFVPRARRSPSIAQVAGDSAVAADMRNDGGSPVYPKEASQPAKTMSLQHRRWHSPAGGVVVDHSMVHRQKWEGATGTRVAHRRL
jgi:hypothetical protein